MHLYNSCDDGQHGRHDNERMVSKYNTKEEGRVHAHQQATIAGCSRSIFFFWESSLVRCSQPHRLSLEVVPRLPGVRSAARCFVHPEY